MRRGIRRDEVVHGVRDRGGNLAADALRLEIQCESRRASRQVLQAKTSMLKSRNHGDVLLRMAERTSSLADIPRR